MNDRSTFFSRDLLPHLTRPQSSLIFSLIILIRDAGAGGDGKAKKERDDW